MGLVFPKNVDLGSDFVCEYCTVRTVVGRELHHPRDSWLLCLERVRILDIVHAWTGGTANQYKSKVKQVTAFEGRHPGVKILPHLTMKAPPISPAIPTMWAELDASIQILTARGRHEADRLPAFNTVRQIRSAIGQKAAWNMTLERPQEMYYEGKRLLHNDLRFTDGATFQLFDKGLGARVGSNSIQATALLLRHIHGLDAWFLMQYQCATTTVLKQQWALAGLSNCYLWLGWLRASENFDLQGEDIQVTPPNQCLHLDINPEWGCVQLRLAEETKTNRTSRADVVMAYTSKSGLSPGIWYNRVVSHGGGRHGRPLFITPEGKRWDSFHYRHSYLYPGLNYLKAMGDATFENKSMKDIKKDYWSLHSYRRGARTDSGRSNRGFRLKRASQNHIYEHGRWRKQGKGERIDLVYQEWTLRDRLKITAECM